jgi:general secretion pathway protein G
MISTLKKLQAKKAAQEINGGFTLIELLIVIVVLGILAAVVVFSLGSVTSKSAVSACQADGATVNTAMAAYNANNGAYPTSTTQLLKTTAGGPYLQSWPNNSAHYLFALGTTGKLYVAIAGTTTAVPGTGWVQWQGSATCSLTKGTGTPAIPSVATVK